MNAFTNVFTDSADDHEFFKSEVVTVQYGVRMTEIDGWNYTVWSNGHEDFVDVPVEVFRHLFLRAETAERMLAEIKGDK